MNLIYFIRPSKLYEKKILDFKNEFIANDESVISGGELLDKLNFDEWISYVQKNSDITTVSSDWVLTDVFFAYEDNKIVGVISFRHKLNDFLKNWGHIGYSVRPSARGNGIATWMLSQVIIHAKNIGLSSLQLSCYEDNIASTKTILKNGGQYVRSFNYLNKKVNVYIIKIKDDKYNKIEFYENC